jgi:hypothetical protein
MNIFVFKTNISNMEERERLALLLDKESAIHHWNVDMEDCDRVLRVTTAQLQPETIISITEQAGLLCSELTD